MIRTGLNKVGKEGFVWLYLLILTSCDPGNDLTFSTDEKYFPLRVGNYWVYTVSETKIILNISEEADYQIKIIATDSFSNVEGKYSYILTRFRRNTENDPWASLDTWVARRNDRELIITQENVPYVKLSFPIAAGKEWNANQYNNIETGISCPNIFNTCDLFTYGESGASFQTTGGLTFSNTAEVIENDASDPTDKIDIRKARYAFDVGLVYSEFNIQNFCTTCPNQFVEDGLIQVMEIIEYGKE